MYMLAHANITPLERIFAHRINADADGLIDQHTRIHDAGRIET